MGTTDVKARVDGLLAEHGRTFAKDAGITLRDTPSPLYQLAVLTTLLSARIHHDIAVAAAKELFKSGYRTPAKMHEASWQQRVDALGRGNYRRYDESTSTALGQGAEIVMERWHGDLRRLRDEAEGHPDRIHKLIQELPRIGPLGADIFCREVQGIWPELRPSLDSRVLKGARKAGLPNDPDELAALVPGTELPRLASALLRLTL